jgi:hypothetical protein
MKDRRRVYIDISVAPTHLPAFSLPCTRVSSSQPIKKAFCRSSVQHHFARLLLPPCTGALAGVQLIYISRRFRLGSQSFLSPPPACTNPTRNHLGFDHHEDHWTILGVLVVTDAGKAIRSPWGLQCRRLFRCASLHDLDRVSEVLLESARCFGVSVDLLTTHRRI